MSSRPLTQTVSTQRLFGFAPNPDHRRRLEIQGLNTLAVRSLTWLFDEREKLFSRRVILDVNGFRHEGASPSRTAIALLGLKRFVESGAWQPFDLDSIREVLLSNTAWVKSIGDLGLLTWLVAEFMPERLEALIHDFDFASALERYPDSRQLCTTGLAWFLSGIAHAQMASKGGWAELMDVAVDTYHMLVNNQSDCGIFGHAGRSTWWSRAFQGRFGTFSDQIHAIYALSAFSRAFEIEEPLASALGCGNAVRALQGERGEWWFLYDKQTCRVANQYPVLSLHQEGTAPVGMFALEESTGQSFGEWVYRGLSWVTGENELHGDLRNPEQGLIWDSMGSVRRAPNYCELISSVLHISRGSANRKLRIIHEARPDHFGWLLYAFGKFGVSS